MKKYFALTLVLSSFVAKNYAAYNAPERPPTPPRVAQIRRGDVVAVTPNLTQLNDANFDGTAGTSALEQFLNASPQGTIALRTDYRPKPIEVLTISVDARGISYITAHHSNRVEITDLQAAGLHQGLLNSPKVAALVWALIMNRQAAGEIVETIEHGRWELVAPSALRRLD